MIRHATTSILALAALVAPQVACADHYAVLVAGSHTYGNYRHHADVAHAYQIALRSGMKKENIIVMMVSPLGCLPAHFSTSCIVWSPLCSQSIACY